MSTVRSLREKGRRLLGRHGWVSRPFPMVCAAAVLWVVVLKISPVVSAAKWDECLYVYDAQRVLSGQVPYRDFFNFTPPGEFFLMAAWFGVLAGKASLTLGRYLSALTALTSWLLAYRTLRRASWQSPAAWAAASLFPVCLYAYWPIPSHHWFANLIFLAAFEGYDFTEGRVRGWRGWLWIGAMGGAALLFLQTVALLMAIFWGILWLLSRKDRWRSLGGLAVGGVSVVGPVLAWFGAVGGLVPYLRDTFWWTLKHYGQAGGPNAVRLLQDLPDRISSLWAAGPGGPVALSPLVALAGTATYLGVLICALAVGGLALWHIGRTLHRRALPPPLTTAALGASALGLALFARGKTDWLHLVFLLGPLGLAWLVTLPSDCTGFQRHHKVTAVLAGGLLLCAALFHSAVLIRHRPSLWEFTDVDRPTRTAPVNEFLRAQPWLKPGDTVAAFPEGGEVYLYVRPAAVGYTLLYPPSERYQGPEDYTEVAAQIERNRPRAIVMTVDREAEYLAPSPLAEIIERRYVRLGRVADAAIYRLREGP